MTTNDLPAPGTDVPQAPRPLWRQPDYRLLWSGQLVSAFGSQMSLVAFPLLILALTGSPAAAGLLGMLQSIPLLVLSIPAGALIDRWNRKWIMIGCDAGRALVLGSIALALLLDQLTVAHLLIAALLEGILATGFTIAQAACLPNLVPRSQLATAIAQTQSIDALGQLLGPMLGGLSYGIARLVPFLLDALSYLISAGSLVLIRAPFQAAPPEDGQAFGAALREGLIWIWRHRLLRFLTVLTLGLMLPAFGYTLTLITLAHQMQASPGMIGIVLATGGVGSLIGTVLAGPILQRFQLRHVILGTIWPWVLSWLPLAIAPNLLVLGIANAIGYIVVPIYMVAVAQVRLSLVPDALQGRITGIYRLVVFGSQPVGIALTGLFLQLLGPTNTVLVLFLPQILLALLTTLHYPRWRSIDGPAPVTAPPSELPRTT